jgi:2,4-dienoyl-CoA reductase (NADPH2)
LNTKVTIDTIKEVDPDAVFLATGSQPIKPEIDGIDKDHVYFANDVFKKEAPVGQNNVIIGGGATGIELALYLAEYGSLRPETFEFLTFYDAVEEDDAFEMLYKGNKKVTVLEKLGKFGSNIGQTTKWILLDKCDKLGVDRYGNVNVTEIGDDFVRYEDEEGTEKIVKNVDKVYYATGVKPNDALYEPVKELGIEVEKIGSARKPETALEAVHRGSKMANRL